MKQRKCACCGKTGGSYFTHCCAERTFETEDYKTHEGVDLRAFGKR